MADNPVKETTTAPDERSVSDDLANALEALMERCFNRNLFPHEVKAALAALDAWHRHNCEGCPDCRGIHNTPEEDAALL